MICIGVVRIRFFGPITIMDEAGLLLEFSYLSNVKRWSYSVTIINPNGKLTDVIVLTTVNAVVAASRAQCFRGLFSVLITCHLVSLNESESSSVSTRQTRRYIVWQTLLDFLIVTTFRVSSPLGSIKNHSQLSSITSCLNYRESNVGRYLL